MGEHIRNVSCFENKNYISHLQYAHVNVCISHPSMSNGWETYRETFDQCINLKAIELQGWNGNSVTEILPNMSEADQEIWNERISYFQARGIRLANQNEIRRNENLKSKLAKEEGATWRFHFN